MADHTSAPIPANPYPFTAAVLDYRAKRYRNLVVVVVLVGLASPTTAFAVAAWWPLLGWLLTVPIVGLGLYLDARSVTRWRAALLDGWAAGVVDLDSLCDGVTSIGQLPQHTIAGMLDPLPTRARLGLERDPPPAVRTALATTVKTIDDGSVRGMLVGVVAATATVALAISATVSGSMWPLVGLPVTILAGRFANRIGH